MASMGVLILKEISPIISLQIRHFSNKMLPKKEKIHGLWDKDEDFGFLRKPSSRASLDDLFLSKLLSSAKRPNVVFPVDSTRVNVLSEPCEFYHNLMVII